VKLLQDAIKERDLFLEEHPELKGLQKEIDETLAKTPEKMRMDTLSTMMFSKATELKEELLKLQGILKNEDSIS
jgi:hypothetical protein